MTTRNAAALLALALGASGAMAADAVKPGQWDFTVTTQAPNTPQLPPGARLPSNGQLPQGGAGMTLTHSSCVDAADPTAELRKPHGNQERCTVDSLRRSGGAASWATTCTTPYATVRSQGAASFVGERMDANIRTETTPQRGAAIVSSSHVVGRYTGPCRGG